MILVLALISSISNAKDQFFALATVPRGEISPFWLGAMLKDKNGASSATKKAIPIKVETFNAMVHAVTEAQYLEFLSENPSWKKEKASQLFVDDTYLSNTLDLGSNPKAPVTNISWFAAQAFCKHYDMRLPTVNEWEYMAAASENKKDANRDEKFLRRILNWYGEPRAGALKQTKSIYKNSYGLWDMHGLVWEWVYDFNSIFVTGESREDSSFDKNLFCGAGAMSGADKENYAAFMRFAFRSSLKGRSSAWNLGFRCVR